MVPDKASGNVLVGKNVANFIVQNLWPIVGRGRIKLMFETCWSHAEHRVKLLLKPMRPHTMAHFRIAGLT